MGEIDSATRQRIEEAIGNWDKGDSEAQKQFEASRDKWSDTVQPLLDAITASERLTEEDFAIRINTRD